MESNVDIIHHESIFMADSSSYTTIEINGFDKDKEPVMKQSMDGKLYVVFTFMPPLNGNYDGRYDQVFFDFHKQIEFITGVKVIKQSNECYLIDEPKIKTPRKIKRFLENFWKCG